MGWCLEHKKRVSKFSDACNNFEDPKEPEVRYCLFCHYWAYEKPKEVEV